MLTTLFRDMQVLIYATPVTYATYGLQHTHASYYHYFIYRTLI